MENLSSLLLIPLTVNLTRFAENATSYLCRFLAQTCKCIWLLQCRLVQVGYDLTLTQGVFFWATFKNILLTMKANNIAGRETTEASGKVAHLK